MKILHPRSLLLFTLLAIAVVAMLLPCFAQAAEAAAPAAAAAEPATASSFILDLVTKWPWLSTVLLVMGGLRIVFKPVMLAIDYYVKSTPSTRDDEALARFETGPIARWLAIGLDFFASIKLPAKKPQS